MLSSKIKSKIKTKETNVHLFDNNRYSDYSQIFTGNRQQVRNPVNVQSQNVGNEQIRSNILYMELINIYKQLNSAVYLRSEYLNGVLQTNGFAISDKLMSMVLKYLRCNRDDLIFFIEDKQFASGVFFAVMKNSLSKECINNVTITITCPMFAISATGKYYYRMKKFNYVRINEDYYRVMSVEDV